MKRYSLFIIFLAVFTFMLTSCNFSHDDPLKEAETNSVNTTDASVVSDEIRSDDGIEDHPYHNFRYEVRNLSAKLMKEIDDDHALMIDLAFLQCSCGKVTAYNSRGMGIDHVHTIQFFEDKRIGGRCPECDEWEPYIENWKELKNEIQYSVVEGNDKKYFDEEELYEVLDDELELMEKAFVSLGYPTESMND